MTEYVETLLFISIRSDPCGSGQIFNDSFEINSHTFFNYLKSSVKFMEMLLIPEYCIQYVGREKRKLKEEQKCPHPEI